MSFTHETAPRRGRRSNAEIAAEKRDRLLESMPPQLPQDIRDRAARQAHTEAEELRVAEMIEVKVTKAGHGKISMGIHVPGIGDAHYERGETFMLAEPIALAQEANGYVRIVGKVYDDD